MLYGIRFKTFTESGEEYSTRFGFFHDIRSAKKEAIRLYNSSPNIAKVVAVDVETDKVIKRVPDPRGGIREGGGRKAFDAVARPYRQTIRFADDVWLFMSHFPDRSEVIHKALREYITNHPITQ